MSTPHVHSWKAVSGFLVVIFLCGLLFGLLPFVVDVYEKQKVLSSQNEQIELMGNWRTQLSELEENQGVLENRLSQMVVELIEEDEFSKIVEQLFSEARSSFVSIKRIQPGGAEANGEYQSKEISLEVSGSYHSIARFVNQVEQNGLMIEIRNLDIEKPGQGNTLNGTINLEITMLRS